MTTQETRPESAGPAIAGAFGEQIPSCRMRPESRGSTIVGASTVRPQAVHKRAKSAATFHFTCYVIVRSIAER